MKIIIACATVIVGITLATFWMQVQTGQQMAEQSRELRRIGTQQIIDGKRIAQLDLERGERQMHRVGK
ncbi:MAG: hypothetical protein AB9917_02085 [Negativicutes bacterium]